MNTTSLSLRPRIHRIIVGVDYGTTYSGVSYVPSNKGSGDDVVVISKWPNHAYNTWKSPSSIAYASENPRISANTWGFEVSRGLKQYVWTKLLLERGVDATQFDDPLLSEMYGSGFLALPNGKSAKDVAEDYLRELYNYTIQVLQKELSPEVFRSTPMDCYVTMPAGWSHKAEKDISEAALSAGFGKRIGDTIHMIREPEAAALTALEPHLSRNSIDPVKVGECVLICDCGGGTVDIITYQVTAVEPVIDYKEICRGMSGRCGATSIDRNFIQWMTQKFGNAYTSVDMKKRGPGSRFMESWESAKRNFSSPDGRRDIEIEPIDMNIPASSSYDDEERTVRLTGREMQKLFDPSVKLLIDLVEQQASFLNDKNKLSIDRFILVGGFGDSPYLNSKLQEWTRTHNVKRFTCPPHCQAAIVKGAALRGLIGLTPSVTISRRHYGWKWNEPFRQGIDPEAQSYIHDWYGVKYCRGKMHWAVKMGQELREGDSASVHMEFTPTGGENHKSTLELYECIETLAPERVEHYSVRKLGTIETDFANVGNSQRESFYSHRLGKTVYRYKYSVTIGFRTKEGILTFKSFAYGREAGSTRIQYE